MLDKNDLKQIEEVVERVSEKVSRRVSKDTTYEFFETVLVPYLDNEHKKHEQEHREMMEKFDEKWQNLAEYIKDHEKRITKLESVVTP